MAEKEAGLSLLDVANVDITGVAELRFENLPIMAGLFMISDARLDTVNEKTAALIECTVRAVENVTGFTGNPADLINKKHVEMFFFHKLEDIGRLKAFVVDTGADLGTEPLPVKVLLEAMKGFEFPGKITHQKDKNNPDRTYAHLNPTIMKGVPPAIPNAAQAPFPPPAAASPVPTAVAPAADTAAVPAASAAAATATAPAPAASPAPTVVLGRKTA